jgi:hypothetical protein
VYLPPESENDAAYALLEEESRARNERLLFFPASASDLAALRVRYPDAEITPMRDWYDYLYNASDMALFPGKRFHGQRSHVNKFDRLYPDWRFEAIAEDNLGDVCAYFESHAERYHNFDLESARELHGEGFLIQMNVYSVKQENYDRIRKRARSLLENRLVDFIGSDSHGMGHRPPAYTPGVDYMLHHYDRAYLDSILQGNPASLLHA